MKLANWIDGLGLTVSRGPGEVDVPAVSDDSRQVGEGGAFIARAGRSAAASEGLAYIRDAVERGGKIVVVPRGVEPRVPEDVTLVTADRDVAVDQALAGQLTERLLGYPSTRLSLIGITGTNGKTTVAWLTQHLLERAGLKTGLIGTVNFDLGRGKRPATLTTPGAVELSYLLREMVDHGCQAAVMEASSHGLAQGRTDALELDVAVFTNLTGDHLDYHPDMDAYAAAKARLFAALPANGWAVVNAEDPYGQRMIDASASRQVIRTRVSDGGDARPVVEARSEAVQAEVERLSASHSQVALLDAPASNPGGRGRAKSADFAHHRWGRIEVSLPLAGRYNVANALQAAAAASCITDVSPTLERSLSQAPPVPGRLERVGPDADVPTVLVDYAHTHDALANVLSGVGPLVEGRLIVLVGCGGDREKAKRPKMARIACDWAQVVWITSDNPRTEDPRAIIDEMLRGIEGQARGRVHVEPDRAKAISEAVAQMQAADTLVIAGKGHEDYQIIGKEKRAFDDRQHAAEALRQWVKQAD